jgi:hypothetical protein
MRTSPRLWLPPKVWLQGSQSSRTGGSSSRKGHTWRICCWFATSSPCGLMTPFGVPVEPEVKRILATVSAATAAARASTSALGWTSSSSSAAAPSRGRPPRAACDRPRPPAAPVVRSVLSEDHARVRQVGHRAELDVVRALQGVGHARRHDRRPDGPGGEREQQVLAAVAGQQQHRTVGETARQQSLRQAVGSPARLAPGEVAPPVRAALGQQQAVGVGLTAGPEDVQQAGRGRDSASPTAAPGCRRRAPRA